MKNTNINIKFNTDIKSCELLYLWFDNQEDKELINKIISEYSNQIMEDQVLLYKGESSFIPFITALKSFSKMDTEKPDIYLLQDAYLQKDKTIEILKYIKENDFITQAINEIIPYFPLSSILDIKCNTYFVLTGWEWGDAYVRNIKKIKGKCKIVENDDEETQPAIIVNLTLVAKLYGDTPKKQYELITTDTIPHELFHFVLEKYKKKYYLDNKKDKSYIEHLVDLIQNEGIAHYINFKNELQNNYHKYKKYESDAFNQLKVAMEKLNKPSLNEEEKQKILMAANVGKYWSKYGAISGMFITYHIEKNCGIGAIQESIKLGTDYFIKIYKDIQLKNSELPELPEQFN